MPPGRTLVLADLIKGNVEQKTDEIGDFVIVRPDGTPLYNFATVVDDAEMEITHVVRAEEHLSNTFSQLLVFEALGVPLPQFAHVPYVAEPGSKKKLSKRFGAVGLDHFIAEGYLPEAMMNYLARLGWSYDDTQEIFSRAELIEKFTLDRVNSSPASHDPDKLFWVEGEWMKTLPLERKVAGVIPFLEKEGLVTEPVGDDVRRRIEAVVTGAGRPAQGLLRHPQARSLLLHRDGHLRPRRREEAAPQGGGADHPRGACRAARHASSRSTCRPWKRPIHDYAESRGLGPGPGRQRAAGGHDGAGGRAGPLRLPGDPRPRTSAGRGSPRPSRC